MEKLCGAIGDASGLVLEVVSVAPCAGGRRIYWLLRTIKAVEELIESQIDSSGDTADLGKRAKEAEKASHYASVRFQPEYARAQDVHDGYIDDDREEAAAE